MYVDYVILVESGTCAYHLKQLQVQIDYQHGTSLEI
jgi:hypothetical protein